MVSRSVSASDQQGKAYGFLFLLFLRLEPFFGRLKVLVINIYNGWLATLAYGGL
jgi:hypothetical protein